MQRNEETSEREDMSPELPEVLKQHRGTELQAGGERTGGMLLG